MERGREALPTLCLRDGGREESQRSGGVERGQRGRGFTCEWTSMKPVLPSLL
jgi:hypothetical protein